MVNKVTEDDPLDFSDPEEQGRQVLYLLDIRLPDSPPQRIQVRGKLVLGQHEQADVHIKGRGLLSKHAIFRISNDVLSMHNFSPETELNGKQLASGRMYILDKGDKLAMGQLDIIIRRDEVEGHELDTPKTNIKNILKYKDELEKNKNDKISNAGLLGKIKSLFGKKNTKPSEQEESTNKKLPKGKRHYKIIATKHPSPPGPLLRTFAVPATLGTVYLTLFGLLPWLQIDGQVFEGPQISFVIQLLKQKMTTLISTYPNWEGHFILLQEYLTPPLLAFVLGVIAIEVLSHVLTGASFGHFVVGVETDDSFIIKRLKALGRLLLWPLSLATVVGELLPILGIRTLKEILTASHPHPKSAFRRFIGIFLFMPLLVLGAPLSALFLDVDFWEGPWEIATPSVRQAQTDTTKVASLFFSGTLELPKDPDLMIFPLIRPHKMADSSLIILETKKDLQVLVRRWAPPQVSFSSFPMGNPILPLLHPDLNKTAESDLVLSDMILGFAFSIQTNNLLDYTMEFGPFSYGLTKFRQHFKEQFQLMGRPEIFRLPTGKNDLWVIRESELKEHNNIFIWNRNTALPSFKLEYDQPSAGFALSILNKILRPIRFDPAQKFSDHPVNSNEESSLFLMDYLLNLPETETLADLKKVTLAMKKVKSSLPKEGQAPVAWQATKEFLSSRWKIPPPKMKDKVTLKNWQKALDEFKKL